MRGGLYPSDLIKCVYVCVCEGGGERELSLSHLHTFCGCIEKNLVPYHTWSLIIFIFLFFHMISLGGLAHGACAWSVASSFLNRELSVTPGDLITIMIDRLTVQLTNVSLAEWWINTFHPFYLESVYNFIYLFFDNLKVNVQHTCPVWRQCSLIQSVAQVEFWILKAKWCIQLQIFWRVQYNRTLLKQTLLWWSSTEDYVIKVSLSLALCDIFFYDKFQRKRSDSDSRSQIVLRGLCCGCARSTL